MNYDRIAPGYAALAQCYSLGRIRACKRWQLRELAAGDRVLYAGAGPGEDALWAARLGARVTVVELAPRMRALAAARFRAASLDRVIELIPGDLLDHHREGHYDRVACNFFLNVFPEPAMVRMLAHLGRLLRYDGKLLLADFAPPGANPLGRALRRAHFGLAVRAFRVLAGNPVHPLYDYAPRLPAAGLRPEASQDFGLFGLALYRTLTARRTMLLP